MSISTRFKIPEELQVRVPAEAMRATVEDLFVAAGMPVEHARQGADVLTWADLRGIDSHGVSNTMTYYLTGLGSRSINPAPSWRITRETPGTATIDSDEGLGLVVGPAAMRLAIEKARNVGIGCVVAASGRHFGAAGYHAALALEDGMVGLAMTVGGLLVAPTFGAKAMVGLNPLAVAAPARREAPFIFDASMSSVAGNKIGLARRIGAPVAGGWIATPDGTPVMEEAPVPDEFLMLPLGATRDIGSHKGYSLALMVDVLCGLLAGVGPGFSANGEVSHHFLAYNVAAFTDLDGFRDQMDEYLKALRECPPAPGQERVTYAGLGMAEALAERSANGIPYHREVVERFRGWTRQYNVPDRLPEMAAR
jgi:LDH2 family malate/lactate/ureidoglycolate dehydrogenase